MRKTLMLIAPVLLVLAACGKTHDSQEGPPVAPADAPPPASAPATPVATDFTVDLNLAGTEPFWAVEIRPGRLTLKRPDFPDMATPNPGPKVTRDGATWTAADAGQLGVVVEKGDCNNGMSDIVYPYRATVTVGGETLKGCGTWADAPIAEPRP